MRPSPPCIYPLQEELGSPALAFVRTACHLLALDSRVADAVAVLRRQLLKLLHVREFGPQADFREVCLGFTLPDVICRCGWREGGGGRGGVKDFTLPDVICRRASAWRIRAFCAWGLSCLEVSVPGSFDAWAFGVQGLCCLGSLALSP